MNQIFNYDNKFYQFLVKIGECLYLGLLWFLVSIPIVTIGASTTALYYTINKNIFNSRGNIWEEFWDSFKSNFKQSTLVWLFVLVIYILTFVNFFILHVFIPVNENPYIDYLLLLILLVSITSWTSYLFPYIARFENSTRLILKYAFVLAFSNFFWSLLLVLLFAIALVIFLLYPPLLIAVIPAYMCCANRILERIFRKYTSPEDLAAEEERNRVARD